MTSEFTTDASLPYNHDLFESHIVRKTINVDGEVPTSRDTHSGNLDRVWQQDRHRHRLAVRSYSFSNQALRQLLDSRMYLVNNKATQEETTRRYLICAQKGLGSPSTEAQLEGDSAECQLQKSRLDLIFMHYSPPIASLHVLKIMKTKILRYLLPKSFSYSTLLMPKSHTTTRKHGGWDTSGSPKPTQGNSRGRGRVRTKDPTVSNSGL
ncbi:hypothetical protein T265_11093 [Opisthorchis viverrini]|uniref:Uncharacterized protein n=1 Tax=Opisthorchis viverrini TaxID=6198 RepID=A0A074Z078_OPIVI|nr:hypothetical protein T265_11093 [Opisthorchis viverrini]KER20328.1 hypothetical protein T265_11093 [Opisthorchis viverrini]